MARTSLQSPFNVNLAQSQISICRSYPAPLNQQTLQTLPSSGGNVDLVWSKPQMLIPQSTAPQQAPRMNVITMPPIPREKFFALLADSFQQARTQPNRQLLRTGSRMIDLYQLYTEVLHFGGVANVSFSMPEWPVRLTDDAVNRLNDITCGTSSRLS